MAVKLVGKFLYGAAFVLLLPAGLAAWAAATAAIVPLAPPLPPPAGLPLAILGALLVLLGMRDLWTFGGGLPMNAFPPPRYVERGVYRFLPHPIYIGFTILCAGVSIANASGSGVWLVCPIVAMGCAALVLGYERHDLAERFGRAPRRLLPAPDKRPATPADRLSCWLFVFLPWLVLYETVLALGVQGAPTAQFAFEPRLPVIEWAELFYFSAYPLTALAPFFARTRGDLRSFCTRALWAMLLAFTLYLAFPLAAPPREFQARTAWGNLLAWERTLDGPACAFPSFHVIWSLLAAELFARRWPALRWIFRGWAALIAASCVATGQHPLADVAAGCALVALVVRGQDVWRAVRGLAEHIANSWREWRIGPVRVINHGIYVGLGAGIALWIAETLAGPGRRTSIVLAALLAVLGAALWAQFIEGSPQLLRPFGFYGGLLGGTLGALLAPLFDASPWLVLAAFSAAGPWAQAMGRLRCLVQGCCHGRPAPEALGIHYLHPRSRVCRMTPWTGVPVHPTPLYSIFWNLLTAIVITRLWFLHAPRT